MARYEVRVLTAKGAQSSIIEASSKQDAERIAKRKGLVLSVKKRFGFDMAAGMTPSERYTFMVRLSAMVGSKVGSAEALRIIVANFGGRIRKVARDMLARVEAGGDLPSAMEADRKNFPVATTALVKAGAQSGETWRALKDAAEFEHKMSSVSKGSMKEMVSAIGSFVMAGALMIGTTEYFGPQVMGNSMFSGSADVDVGWIQTLGSALSYVMIVLLTIFAGLLWLGTVGRRMMPTFADKIILKIPYYKDLILSRNNYVILYKLGLLIRSGVRIEEALSLTEEGSPKGALKNDLRAALGAVRSGRPWASVMATLHATDRAALVSSTDREDIARTMDMLSTQYRDLYIQRMTSFAPVLQLISALFMTLAGGVLFGLTILPMLQLAAGMSK